MPIPTIEEYLQMSDWNFGVSIKEGCHANFYWLRSRELVMADLLATIDLPRQPFSVLVTYWDWHGGGSATYGNERGWRHIGKYAISDASTVLPELHYGADCGQMLLDEQIADSDLLKALSRFDEPYMLDDLEEEHAKNFWAAIEVIKPFCYFSYGLFDGFTFVARGLALYRQFMERVSPEAIEQIYKERAAANRAKTWEDLGPECGPETCIEPNCDRLRIRLAIRCFIHQLQWGGSTPQTVPAG